MINVDKDKGYAADDYIAVKAVSGHAQVIGMTRGDETRPHHTENLEQGEVLIVQFTSKTGIIKIRGNAEVYTKFGVVTCEKR